MFVSESILVADSFMLKVCLSNVLFCKLLVLSMSYRLIMRSLQHYSCFDFMMCYLYIDCQRCLYINLFGRLFCAALQNALKQQKCVV